MATGDRELFVILLTKVGLATLKDYEAQRKTGRLSFEPKKLSIRGAELWGSILARHKAEKGE